MNHPDDAQALRDWPLYGPRNEDIANLVVMISDHGIRLSMIEAMIVFMLADWFDEISKRNAKEGSDG